jgi:hypothetical protein
MRNASYNMERRENETWKKDNVERMEAQRTSTEKLGHSQKWMKKTEQLDMNEGIKNEASLIFSEAYVGSCGNNHVHM